MLIAPSPMNSASVVTISKYTRLFTPIRPTLRKLPCPAIPVTSVPKISGATITLIKRRKISLNTRKCSANCGRSRPISPPSSIAKKIQYVSDALRHPPAAIAATPAHRTIANHECGTKKSGSTAPATNSNTPIAVTVRDGFDARAGFEGSGCEAGGVAVVISQSLACYSNSRKSAVLKPLAAPTIRLKSPKLQNALLPGGSHWHLVRNRTIHLSHSHRPPDAMPSPPH